jgi:xanthine dehydrogenase accessory factor
MKNIYDLINEYQNKNQQVWIITVTSNTGSIPGRTGMKMLVDQNAQIHGTIGGGLLEHWIIERIIKEKPIQSQLWEYELNEHFENQVGMICGGTLNFLIEPLIQGDYLFIYGAGHCAMALSELSAKCGFLPVIIDDRPEWANPQKHPFAHKIICDNYDNILNHLIDSPKSYHIIMTHGHKNDEKILKLLIDNNLFFLGMIGSKQKVNASFQNLIKSGVNPELLKKVHAPIGIPIGSHEPFEIAVSIMAQLIKIKNTPI